MRVISGGSYSAGGGGPRTRDGDTPAIITNSPGQNDCQASKRETYRREVENNWLQDVWLIDTAKEWDY
jgi:hypothetical protein